MRGSYLAKLVDEENKRERKRKEIEFNKKKCSKCKNKTTYLCSIVQGIDGKLQCVNYEEE